MTRTRSALIAATAVLGLSSLTACGSGYGSSAADGGAPETSAGQSAPAPEPSSPSVERSTPAAEESAPGPSLATAQAGNLGAVVTDGSGRTLYVFGEDTSNPAKSNCDGACAALWPPVWAGSGTPQLNGIQAEAGTVVRSDGTKQLTLGGLPVYLYTKDTKAGDTNGQGIRGKWWAISPAGEKITKPADTADDSAGY